MIKTLSKFESQMSHKVFFPNKGSDINYDFIYESFQIQILIKTLSKKIKSYQRNIYSKFNMLFCRLCTVQLLNKLSETFYVRYTLCYT